MEGFLNCAQKVAAALGQDDRIAAYVAMGGGKAPEGMCGALYAALQSVPEARRAEVRKRFIGDLGADTCCELKKIGVPCPQCVAKGIELAEEFSRQK